jgi:cytolysin-activating lysine-acyltransferase
MDRLSERQYLADPTSLGKADWCSGDRIWLIDWLGSTAVNRLMAQMLKTRVLPAEVLRTLRVSPGRTTGRILSFQGAAIDRDVARARLQAYHADYAAFAASARLRG